VAREIHDYYPLELYGATAVCIEIVPRTRSSFRRATVPGFRKRHACLRPSCLDGAAANAPHFGRGEAYLPLRRLASSLPICSTSLISATEEQALLSICTI